MSLMTTVDTLRREVGHLDGADLLEALLDGGRLAGQTALVSSFGAESVVLLHMVAKIDRRLPVIFLDTGKLFPATLAYRDHLVRRLGLLDVRSAQPDVEALGAADPIGDLHASDPDVCCHVRKTELLETALAGFSAWITGRKRFQGASRESLTVIEPDAASGRIKLNPLAPWAPEELEAYRLRHDLPEHPLIARGYRSIGCAPCTKPVAAGEDSRAGRWAGLDKTECGIHGYGAGI